MARIFKIAIFFSFLFYSSIGKSQSYKQCVKYADDFLQKTDYYNAIAYYQKAIEIDSTKNSLLYKYAESLRMTNNYSKAKYYYTKVYKTDTNKEFTESAFWIGHLEKSLGNYDEALKYWKLAQKRATEKNGYEFLKIKQEINSSEFAKKNDITLAIKINQLDKNINSTTSEFSPSPYNENELYFSRLNMQKTDSVTGKSSIQLYKGIKENGVWKTIEVDTTMFGKRKLANVSFSSDKKRMYYTVCNDSSRCDIFVSVYNNRNLTNNTYLPINNTQFSSTHPMECKVGHEEVLFFSSNRDGGIGKFDIWYSILKNGVYSTPKNAGNTINSIDNEITPFYDSENQMLFFSSDWHNGFGGFDIFKSKGILDKFEVPINLMKPINSSSNDLYYTQIKDSTSGYFVSNRVGSYTLDKETCCNDIYSFEHYIPEPIKKDTLPIDILTYTPKTNSIKSTTANPIFSEVSQDSSAIAPVNIEPQKVVLNLYFHNDEPNPRTNQINTQFTYLETFDKYIQLKEEYYKKAKNPKDISILYTQYIERGRKNLDKFMNLLQEQLKSGEVTVIKIRGFSSPLNKSDYNLNLSKRRIDSFKNHIKNYNGGVFKKHILSGQILFIETPFGEFVSGQKATDNPKDPASIYSLEAGLERRIEISFEY